MMTAIVLLSCGSNETHHDDTTIKMILEENESLKNMNRDLIEQNSRLKTDRDSLEAIINSVKSFLE